MENLAGFETWFFGGVISITLIIIGFFLKRNLDKLEETDKIHGAKLAEHDTHITVLRKDSERYEDNASRNDDTYQKIQANLAQILMKIK